MVFPLVSPQNRPDSRQKRYPFLRLNRRLAEAAPQLRDAGVLEGLALANGEELWQEGSFIYFFWQCFPLSFLVGRFGSSTKIDQKYKVYSISLAVPSLTLFGWEIRFPF